MTSDQELKRTIQTHYTALAERSGSCCGPDCCGSTGEDRGSRIYTQEQLRLVPSDAAGASAGCGNPTAFGELKPGETVVDLGSGGGIDAFLAARAVGEQGRVIGIDFTPAMIDLATRNAAKIGAGNVEFRLGEIESIPLPNACADVIMSNCVINLSRSKESVFREAFRVLRPGGRVYVSDIVLARPLPSELGADRELWAACVAGAELKERYLGMVEGAGFADVQVISEALYGGSRDPKLDGALTSLSFKARRPAMTTTFGS